ncbi:hypothetical protein DFH09DRAFT_1076702 [Mycena vulgaris]|nr:hypothetical protein DFH09DRAFT_1076702 [Mycena vulgaris]
MSLWPGGGRERGAWCAVRDPARLAPRQKYGGVDQLDVVLQGADGPVQRRDEESSRKAMKAEFLESLLINRRLAEQGSAISWDFRQGEIELCLHRSTLQENGGSAAKLISSFPAYNRSPDSKYAKETQARTWSKLRGHIPCPEPRRVTQSCQVFPDVLTAILPQLSWIGAAYFTTALEWPRWSWKSVALFDPRGPGEIAAAAAHCRGTAAAMPKPN